MFESAKVMKDIVLSEIQMGGKRKEYGFGNGKYDMHKSRKEVYALMQHLCKNMVRSAGIQLEVMGRENLPKEGPVLYIATHKSVFDIVILTSIIEEPTIFIGKKEVNSMPIVHKWFDALGCIYLDRDDMRQALQSILKGVSELKRGQSIVLFPEGTRSMSNEIKPFKEGGFKLAAKTGVPIIPIAMSNTYRILEEKKRIQKTKVTVNIGKPIITSELSKEELAHLPKLAESEVHRLMEAIEV